MSTVLAIVIFKIGILRDVVVVFEASAQNVLGVFKWDLMCRDTASG